MEMRITELGSKRYSFPLGKQNPSEVLRIFERDNKLSMHFVHKHMGKGLKTRTQFILAVRNNKLYMYLTQNREMIRALTLDRVSGLTITIAKIIFDQSAKNKGMALGSIQSVKSILYKFLKSNIDWYPKVNCSKLRMIDLITIGCSKILADKYVHEDVICTPPGAVQNILRHSNTLSEMSKKIFGFTSPWAQEQSVRVLFGKLPHALLFKGIIPVDNIKKIYNDIELKDSNMVGMYWMTETASIRRFIKMFHKDTIMNWYKPLDTKDIFVNWYKNEADRYLMDTARMWEMIPEELREIPRGMTNLKNIHDLLSSIHRKARQQDFKLKPNKKALEIDGHIVKDMEIVVPKTNHELIEWGTNMSNCIASYAERKATLFGIKRKGVLEYCIEIKQGIIWQFKGKFNKDAPRDDYDTISNYLLEKEIIKEETMVPAY